MTSPQSPAGRPFRDAELAGVSTVAVEAVETLVASLPQDRLTSDAPKTEMLLGAWVDQNANWRLAHYAIDLLGTLLSDQFGAMRLDPPAGLLTFVTFSMTVLVPDAVALLKPQLEAALAKVVRQAVGANVAAFFTVMPRDELRGVPLTSSGTVSRVAAWVSAADRIAVLTGAGISTESGIPDYRGPDGAWTTNPASMRLVDIDAYLADPQVRVDAWQERMHHAAWTAEPGPGHQALVDLERLGKLRAVITQNIDGLHQAAGSSPKIVMELHGTIRLCRCLECGYETPMQEQLYRVQAGEPDPHCIRCGGLQKSATVAFGQSLDSDLLRRAIVAAGTCQLFLAVGTSLQVMPATRLCDIALGAGARLVIVNAEPTPYDHSAAAVLRGSIGETLPAIVGSA
jgi:NAD-dependent deacetylase